MFTKYKLFARLKHFCQVKEVNIIMFDLLPNIQNHVYQCDLNGLLSIHALPHVMCVQ